MREIKFRAWDGDEMHNYIWMDFKNKSIMVDNDLVWFQPKELMQYTGLKDKNGVEIYEGDIVEVLHSNEIGVVTYEMAEYRLMDKQKKYLILDYIGEHSPVFSLSYLYRDNTEVIGNIYENQNY